MNQTVLPALSIPTKQKHRRIAAALLFGFAAITCSLTGWAMPGGRAPNATTGQCGGVPGAQILYPFADDYSCVSLGAVPGVPTSYGGLTFKYDDPDTILIGGAANTSIGHIYKIAVARDPNGHITGFSGNATLYPGTGSKIGQYNDGGLAFGPGHVLFATRYPFNQLEQSTPGSLLVNKVADLTAAGVASSVGSLAFVPPGFPGAAK